MDNDNGHDRTFYQGSWSNGADHSISDHLNTKQEKFAIRMFATQIPQYFFAILLTALVSSRGGLVR